MSQSRYHSLTVREVVDETHDAKSIVFEVPTALADTFKYRPGQFLTLRLPVLGRNLPRCYSMSSAPTLDNWLRVTVKRVQGGRGSNWLCDNLKAGQKLEVMAPAGIFVPGSLQGDFLLCAGGSGITPVFSILRSALSHGQGRIRLLYANRDERSVIFRDELNALAAQHPGRLHVQHWLDSVQGVPSVAQLAEIARPWLDSEAFICGPAPFMDAMVSALDLVGMDGDKVHVERFASLPDEEDIAAINAVAAAAPAASAAVDATVEILLDGEVHTLEVPAGVTVLDAALKAGINAPYSCQAGMCASCMCQVEEGEVQLRHNEVLDDRDLAKRWTLSCQALPTTPRLRVKFP
ncbi:MAG: ferredoxin--NADP reductase [Thauera sp.]|jgi:3-ketosteroid 9alpha-monooxygenase subunit B|nr:ferredoxin--NADP reductase [Thauera sp.]